MFSWSRVRGGVELLNSCETAPQPQTLERVEITGSAIKRIEGEDGPAGERGTTKQEIDQLGVVNAAQLVDKLVANSGQGYQLSNALGDAARPGFSGASLRGLGSNSTLISLNGRRMAVYAFDGGAVNLQQIPFAAIERVEVLGEDAVGHLRYRRGRGRDQLHHAQGLLGLSGLCRQAYLPQEKGGEQYQAEILAGWGDLAKDRFNVFGVLSYTGAESVKSADRDFSKTALRRDISVDPNMLRVPVLQPAELECLPGQRSDPGGCVPAAHTRLRLPALCQASRPTRTSACSLQPAAWFPSRTT